METLDENAGVISASKVTGTNVYNTEGDLLGEIHDVMLDKRSGRIAYAIMSFGGFLGRCVSTTEEAGALTRH